MVTTITSQEARNQSAELFNRVYFTIRTWLSENLPKGTKKFEFNEDEQAHMFGAEETMLRIEIRKEVGTTVYWVITENDSDGHENEYFLGDEDAFTISDLVYILGILEDRLD